MKKQITKITLKTDKVVLLSKNQAQRIGGGFPTLTKPATHGPGPFTGSLGTAC